MDRTKLPTEQKGQWIWSADALHATDSYLFLRREFTLSETPSSAELWVAANTAYHLYINGRHFCRGPSPAVAGRSYASFFDISYCLEIGKNTIAVLAHNVNIPRYGNSMRPGGFWCQLNIDTVPFLWTDDSWRMQEGNCYIGRQPRVSPAAGFVEHIDLREYPSGWEHSSYESLWRKVDSILPAAPEELLPAPDFEPFSEVVPFVKIAGRGVLEPSSSVLNICFTRIHQNASGVYAAETYLHLDAARDNTSIQFFCDDAYFFFINGNLILRRGGEETPVNWAHNGWHAPLSLGQEPAVRPFATVNLRKGWNRLLFFQQVQPESTGATLVLDEYAAGSLKFVRSQDSFSLPGWNVTGPLNMPFANIVGSMNFEPERCQSYFNFDPCDIAAHLQAFAARAADVHDGPLDMIELAYNDYVTLELERYLRGCPEFHIAGTPGDVIDVFYNEAYDDGFAPLEAGSRKVYTVVVGENEERWTAMVPHGMRFVTIFGRKVAQTVTLRDAGVRKLTFSFKNPGGFNSSDDLLNKIWLNGAYTLDATHDYIFLTSPGHEDSQLLADAMIQSMASYFLIGNFALSEKALREFAASQLPTGEIPAMAPADYTVRLHDMALLYPDWLQQHVLYSGDRKIIEDLAPTLKRMLEFFRTIEDPEHQVLGNSHNEDAGDFLIDFVGEIDRRGISTALNSLYCHALLRCQWLFAQAGDEEFAARCHRRASEIAQKIRELSWDGERRLFADGFYDGAQTESHSMQANILAISAGIASPEHYEDIFAKLLVEYPPYHQNVPNVETDSPYFKTFLLETAFSCNNRDWALDFLRYYWGSMVQRGTTTWWERFSPEPEFDVGGVGARCRGFGVSPNYFLIREVVGIRPAGPGSLQVYFNPLLTATEWVQAQIPTQHGQIRAEWSFENPDSLEIVIDADYPLEVIPMLDPAVLANATFHVSDIISVLTPPAG